jgi:hypothetical protein
VLPLQPDLFPPPPEVDTVREILKMLHGYFGEQGRAKEVAQVEALMAQPAKAVAEEPIKTIAKGPLQLRAERLFKRRETTPLTSTEVRAFKNNKSALLATIEPEWLALEEYYASDFKYKRTDLATLLNNWCGEIDRAKAWKRETQGSYSNQQPKRYV